MGLVGRNFGKKRGYNKMTRIEQPELDILLRLHAETWVDSFDANVTFGETLSLVEYNLSGLDLSNRELRSCHLVNCDLRNCNFTNSNISHSEFTNSDLRGAIMTGVIDEGTDYMNSTM